MVEQAVERGSAQSGLNAFSFFAGVGRGLPTVVSKRPVEFLSISIDMDRFL